MHALLDVRCGALAGPTTEDEEIGERVAPKAVRAVQTTGDLAGGEEPGHAGGSTLGVDLDPTHRVVDGWEDLHRLAGDVYVGEFEKLLVHGWQLLHDPFVAEVRDIQVDPSVLAAAAFLYLCVVRPRHHVACGELHLLGVVVLHVPHTLRVAEQSSLAAHALGDEQTAHAWRPDHPGRMELHHLHVHQLGPSVVAEDHAVPRSLPGVGGDLEDASPPAGRHDDSPGLEMDELAVLTRVGQGSDDPSLLLEELGDGRLHVDLRVGGENLLLHGPDELQPGPVADVAEAAIGMAAEGALAYLALGRPVEGRPPLLELVDPVWCLFGEGLDHPPVVEELAAPHGVDKVLAPGVVGVDVPDGGRNAALGHDGVSLAQQALGDDADRQAVLGRRDRGPETRSSGADDQDVVLARLVCLTVSVVSVSLQLHHLPQNRQVGYDARLNEPEIYVREQHGEEAVPGPLRVPQVQAADAVVNLAPGVAPPNTRVAILVAPDDVPQRVAREAVSGEQDHVDQPDDRTHLHPERTSGEERQNRVIPQEGEHHERGVQEVPVDVVEHEHSPLAPVVLGLARLSLLSPGLAGRRVPEKRPVVGLAVVVARRPEAQRHPDYEHRRCYEARHPVRMRNRRRVERREIILVLARQKRHDEERVETENTQYDHNRYRLDPPR